jgi:hypothetical protein
VFVHSERADTAGIAAAHKNFTIERNYFKGVNCYGIGFTACNGFLVRNNLMVRSPGQDTTDFNTPQVYFANGTINRSANGVITGNAWPLIGGQSSLKFGPDGGNAGSKLPGTITQSGNLIAPGQTPAGWAGFDVALGIYGPYGNG